MALLQSQWNQKRKSKYFLYINLSTLQITHLFAFEYNFSVANWNLEPNLSVGSVTLQLCHSWVSYLTSLNLTFLSLRIKMVFFIPSSGLLWLTCGNSSYLAIYTNLFFLALSKKLELENVTDTSTRPIIKGSYIKCKLSALCDIPKLIFYIF